MCSRFCCSTPCCSAVAAERRRLLHGARSTACLLQARRAAIDRDLLSAVLRSAANPSHAGVLLLIDRTDRRD